MPSVAYDWASVDAGEGVGIGFGVEPVEDVCIRSVVAIICEEVKQFVLWKNETVLEVDGVDSISQVVSFAGLAGLKVDLAPVGIQLYELTVGPFEDCLMVSYGIVSSLPELDGYFEIIT